MDNKFADNNESQNNNNGEWVTAEDNTSNYQMTQNNTPSGYDQNIYNNYYNAGVYDDNQPGVSGMAVASMILGILSVVTGCVFCLGGVLSILAIIFGGVSFQSPKGGRGMAIAGIVTGIVGVVISIIYTIYYFIVIAAL